LVKGIRDIDRTIADLQALRATLAAARQTARNDQRRGHAATVCRIIEAPIGTSAPPASAR
jgi:MerR family transcriptional regulator, copper efflux regulator